MVSMLLWTMSATAGTEERRVYVIDKDVTYQVIDNFSASDAWRCMEMRLHRQILA